MARPLSIRTPTATPPAAHLVMGSYLRALRNATERSKRTAGTVPGGRRPVPVSRMENAAAPMERPLVTQLLRGYGLDPAEAEAIAVLLPDRATPSAARVGCDDLWPGAGDRLAACEHNATAIRCYGRFRIPPLLQTPRYAAAANRWRAERPPSVRLALSRTWDPEDGRPFKVILDEEVLHAPVGDHQVMAAQCGHLLYLMGRHQLHIQLLPFGAEMVFLGPGATELVLGGGHRLYALEGMHISYTTDPYTGAQLDKTQDAAASVEDTRRLLDQARIAYQSGTAPALQEIQW